MKYLSLYVHTIGSNSLKIGMEQMIPDNFDYILCKSIQQSIEEPNFNSKHTIIYSITNIQMKKYPIHESKWKTFSHLSQSQDKKYNQSTEHEKKGKKVISQFSGPYHAYNSIIYANPHEKKERNQILQLETKNYESKSEKVLQNTEIQFIRLCKNGQYDTTAKLHSLGKVESSEFNVKQNEENKQAKAIHLGKNIIRTYQSTKYEKIVYPFQQNFQNGSGLIMRGDFECGNMAEYFQMEENQYVIILKNDTNTCGYNQYFQFYIQKTGEWKADKMVNFVIVNISKLIYYVPGMKFFSCSNKEELRDYGNWERNIDFFLFESNVRRENGQKYYHIAFSINESELTQGLFISLVRPYSYSRLKYLHEQLLMSTSNELETIQIGKTTLGNSIMVFKLSQPSKNKNKRNIVILARQHSSETSSSFVIESILKRLVFFNHHQTLLQQYNWHIIPILNPDGVIHGNSRVNAKGYDINRCWTYSLFERSREALYLNSYLQGIKIQKEDIFLDLHSHSRDLGCFSFFNFESEFSRFFNAKMSQICPFYEVSKCKIGIDASKRNTFRVQMNTRLKIKNIITFQTSYYGYICKESKSLKSFTTNDYELMALGILQSIQSYLEKENIIQIEGKERKSLYEIKQYQNSQSDSDTDPEGDYLNQQERKQIEEASNRPNTNKNKESLTNSMHIKKLTIERKRKSRSQRSITEISVLNIYQRSLKVTTYNSMHKHKIPRSFSENQKEQLGNNQEKKEALNKLRSSLGDSLYLKQGETIKAKEIQNREYMVRSSFKSLFASAQLRNQSVSQNQKNSSRVKDNQISHGAISISEQKDSSRSKVKKVASVKNINFPLETNDYDETDKQIRLILCNAARKKIKNRLLSFHVDRKQQNTQKYKINEKLAKLCEFAKNIEKFSSLN